MLSSEQISSLISERLVRNKRCVLATVVSVQGSAYRREGSKMMIDENGDYFGMISGGCLEADVVEVAKMVLEKNKPILKEYVLDEELVWGLGLGCPGTVGIFLEPIEPQSPFWRGWTEQINASLPFVTCKVLSEDKSLPHSLMISEGKTLGQCDDQTLKNEVYSIARTKLTEKNSKSESIFFTGGIRVFFDIYQPPPHIYIFGAGHDAIPVAQLAYQLGFQTSVIDGRPAFNTKERFPNAKRLALMPREIDNTNIIRANSTIVIMNHHLEKDMETLALALKSQASYVGVLGPKKRREKMLESLKDLGVTFTSTELEKMYSPIGLDIGAETPEEIALSIMSEIVAFHKGHTGRFLKDNDMIHRYRILEEQR